MNRVNPRALVNAGIILVTPAGFEPAIFWMRTRYPKPLDEGALLSGFYCNKTGVEYLPLALGYSACAQYKEEASNGLKRICNTLKE